MLPIPFTEEAVRYTSDRIRQVQDRLGTPLVLENGSYYLQAHKEMAEEEFINAIIADSGCEMLLDVNNVYVNSINHRYDPIEFIDSLPLESVRYMHVAGHFDEAEDLKVDTHGTDVIEAVWALLDETYKRVGPVPTLLERDFNFPELSSLLAEVQRIRDAQAHSHAHEKDLTTGIAKPVIEPASTAAAVPL